MPSSNKAKDSTTSTWKQTRLFDNAGSSSRTPQRSNPARRRVNVEKTSLKHKNISSDKSSDELSGMHIAASDKPCAPSAIMISSDDEDIQCPPSTSRRKRPTRIRSVVVSGSEQASDQDRSLSKRHQSDEREDDEPPRKKSRLHRRKSLKIKSTTSNEDIAELVHEVDEQRILDSRLRTRNKTKSAFQLNLEKLKRRKLKIQDDTNSQAGQHETTASEEDDEEENPPKPFKGSRPSGEHSDDSDGDIFSDHESDFIVEDDDVAKVELPPEFSMETHQDISHQFKKIFQFFVHLAVQPPHDRAAYMKTQIQDEQYFSVPLQVMRRKLSGLRDSLVSSSVWRPEFKKALESYPELALIRLDFAVPTCDACHLGGRMSTLLGRLSGSQYNDVGFEPKSSDDDAQQEFHLGRFCARRSKVFHEFSHWEYDLFHQIVREIDPLKEHISSKRFHRAAYVGGMEPPENLQDADGLCDWLDRRKVIDMEWQRMKSMMESARSLEIDHKEGNVDG